MIGIPNTMAYDTLGQVFSPTGKIPRLFSDSQTVISNKFVSNARMHATNAISQLSHATNAINEISHAINAISDEYDKSDTYHTCDITSLYPVPTSSSGYEYDDDDNSTLLANTSAMDVFDALTLKHALLRLEMDDDKLRELVVHCSSMMRK
jgi:hypothetical protein